MKDIVGHRLPKFTTEQKAKLKASTDFVGLNYYTSVFSNHLEKPDPSKPRWMQDSLITWECKFVLPLLETEPRKPMATNQRENVCFWY